jgi:hypothetical protein
MTTVDLMYPLSVFMRERAVSWRSRLRTEDNADGLWLLRWRAAYEVRVAVQATVFVVQVRWTPFFVV